MRNELNKLIAQVENPQQKKVRPGQAETERLLIMTYTSRFLKLFDAEMQGFLSLFNRYLSQRAKNEKLYQIQSSRCHLGYSDAIFDHREWDKVHSPSSEQVVAYSSLPEPQDAGILEKVCASCNFLI